MNQPFKNTQKATERLRHMMNKGYSQSAIKGAIKGCRVTKILSLDGARTETRDASEWSYSDYARNYTVLSLPVEQVTVTTDERPARMHQDDHKAIYDREDNLGFLVNEIHRAREDIQALRDNALHLKNGEGSKIRIDTPDYYRPMFIQDKQNEILAIVSRMRELLTDIAKENGGF